MTGYAYNAPSGDGVVDITFVGYVTPTSNGGPLRRTTIFDATSTSCDTSAKPAGGIRYLPPTRLSTSVSPVREDNNLRSCGEKSKMGDTQMTARWYEQVRREKRAKDKWQAKYLTEEQLELERQAEAAALSELRGRPKHKKLSERDAMLMRLAAVEREAGEAADEEAAGEEGGAATGGVPQARRMTAHQVARERIRQEVAATRERNHRITHDLTTESLLNDLGPALWISFNAGYKHPGATPGTRTGVSTIQKTHIYDPKADGAAKWSADIDKTHNLKMDTFMKHADKCLQLGEKPFKSGGMKLAAGQ